MWYPNDSLLPDAVRAAVLASAVPVTVSAKATGQSVVIPSDTEEDNTEDEASAASTAQPAQESPTVAETPSLYSNHMPAGGEGSNKIVLGTILRAVVFAHLLRLFSQKKKKTFFVQGKHQNIN